MNDSTVTPRLISPLTDAEGNTDLTPGQATQDPDLAAQAAPGLGVPSQHPEPAAQRGLSAEESERESKSALMGGGMMTGAAAGAAVGAAVAGPLGVFVGGTVGAVTGALGGAAVGQVAQPETPTDPEPADPRPEVVEVGSPALIVKTSDGTKDV